MVGLIKALFVDESGQGLPEYALLVAAVVVMVVTASILFKDAIAKLFTDIGTYISSHSQV